MKSSRNSWRSNRDTVKQKVRDELKKYQDTYDHSKLNQENINHLNRSMTCNAIEASIKSFPKKKNPRPDGFSAELYQTFKEELITTLLKLFHEIEREGTLPNSFYEASITLIQKELQANLLNEHGCKNLQ
jgi:hypothetical protein